LKFHICIVRCLLTRYLERGDTEIIAYKQYLLLCQYTLYRSLSAASLAASQILSGPVRIGSNDMQPVSSIHDLGVYIDADMTMRTYVTAVVSVLHGSTSDPERAAISVTSCLVDLGSCTDCQEGGLLQLCSRWYPRPAARPAAVRLECRRPFSFLSEAVRMKNPLLRELHRL